MRNFLIATCQITHTIGERRRRRRENRPNLTFDNIPQTDVFISQREREKERKSIWDFKVRYTVRDTRYSFKYPGTEGQLLLLVKEKKKNPPLRFW